MIRTVVTGYRVIRCRALLIGLALLLPGLAGCGNKTLAPQAEPAAAREGLTAALEAWKRGDSRQSLTELKPAIHMSDDDWHKGTKLIAYELIGDGEIFGVNFNQIVKLTLQDRDGKPRERRIRYAIGTRPVISISREDRRKD